MHPQPLPASGQAPAALCASVQTVEEGMLVEPTETESLDTLDAFADALIAIAHEARAQPELVREAPHAAPVRRLDETSAARHPDLRWQPMTGRQTPCPD